MAEAWDVKLDRAREHLVELRRSISALRDSGDFAVTIDESGIERVVRLVLKSDPPVRLSSIVGDFVHNLRSSLDCVMLAACERSGPLPLKQESRVQFPITSTPSQFDDQRSRIATAEAEIIDMVQQMQPWYWIVQGSAPPADDVQLTKEVQHHQLAAIAYLSNIDKHRRIHLTSWYAKDIFIGTPDGIEVSWRNSSETARRSGEIGRWIIRGDGADAVKLTSNGEAGLTLQRYVDLGWRDVELTGLLQGHLQHVEWVVGVLAVRIGRR